MAKSKETLELVKWIIEKLKTATETSGLVRVTHIPVDVCEEELKVYFSQFGRVTNVKLCRTNISGNSKGYGFVEFDTPEMAIKACEPNKTYKNIYVASHVPEEERPPYVFNSVQNKITHGKCGKAATPKYQRLNRIAGRRAPYSRIHSVGNSFKNLAGVTDI